MVTPTHAGQAEAPPSDSTASRESSPPQGYGLRREALSPIETLAQSVSTIESGTTLGSEARNPLVTIPRAVIQSSILGGAFFIVCAYAEVLGFRAAGQDLGASQASMHVLAARGASGLDVYGWMGSLAT
jgi:amino acid transporter